jgi:hypothetical protein
MHKIGKSSTAGAAAAADSRRSIGGPWVSRVSHVQFYFFFVFVIPRSRRRNRSVKRWVLAFGYGNGCTRQVEYAGSEPVMDRDVLVFVRRFRWCTAERPCDVLQAVRRSLHHQTINLRKYNTQALFCHTHRSGECHLGIVPSDLV